MHTHMHMQVTFAIKRGYWKGGATDPAFSFSGTYDPVTFEGARFCEVLPRHPFACCTPQPHAAPPLHAAPLSMMHPFRMLQMHRLAC